MSATPRPLPLLRALVIGASCLALLTTLGGGSSCRWSSNHSGNRKDDDDRSSASVPSGGETAAPSADLIRRELADLTDGILMDMDARSTDLVLPDLGSGTIRLTDYKVDLEPRAGHHPIARLREIHGLSVFAVDQRGAVGPDDFTRFTMRVIEGNPGLLGLPAAAGHLRPRSVHSLDNLVAVVHEQVPGRPGDAQARPAPGTAPGTGPQMIFVFDLLGRLVQIENRTTLPRGVVVTLPEELLARQ